MVQHDPVIYGNETKEYPQNFGIAGGGTILEDEQHDGSIIYRQYYTLAIGGSPGVPVGQRKLCAVAHSRDGIRWTNHSIVLRQMAASVQPREDIACAAPVVWIDKTKSGDAVYRMVYSAIGTKWGFYSLAQASSWDGYTWCGPFVALMTHPLRFPSLTQGHWCGAPTPLYGVRRTPSTSFRGWSQPTPFMLTRGCTLR